MSSPSVQTSKRLSFIPVAQWAKERKLAELDLEAPVTSKLKGKQAATKGGKK